MDQAAPPGIEISVIIPTYNRSGFLQEAIQSVLDQDHWRTGPEWELLVVAFPFAMQLEGTDASGAPQRVLAGWADERGVDFVDLLPSLREEMRARGGSPEALFLDHDHLSAEGHRVVATLLAEWFSSRAGTGR